MLATKLSRARLELQAHRTWLSTFSLRSNASSSFSTTAQTQAHPAKPQHFTRPSSFKNKKPQQSGKPFAQRKKAQYDAQLVELQGRIQEASHQKNFDEAMDAYRLVDNKKLILPGVLNQLTQQLSIWTRIHATTQEGRQDPEAGERLQQYAEELVQDVYKGVLGPCPSASAHLLHGFVFTRTWDTATKLWEWLKAQDDEYVSDEVYGAAISLLAAQDAKLEDLEALYQEGLARLPVGFAAYHFSPGAIVPNRKGIMPLRHLANPLLLAIMQARLMRGDAQNAYLALDAIRRLRPIGTPPLFFTDFLRERPVNEAYTVFAMACKAGTPRTSNTYRSLLAALRTNVDSKDIKRFVPTVRAMLSTTYLQIGGGGKITRNAVTEIIIVLSAILRIQGVNTMSDEDRLRLAQVVKELISKTLELALRFGVSPTIAAYNSIITNIAGAGNAEATITEAIKEAKIVGLEPNIVTRRSIIVAAGNARDSQLVEKGWNWLVEARARDDQLVDSTDLHILVKACAQSDHDSFATDVVSQATHMDEWATDNLLERLEKKTDLPVYTSKPADINELLTEIAKIKADLEVFDERTTDAKGFQDFSDQAVPMLLFPPRKDIRLPEAEMRKLYDELSTDPGAPPQTTVEKDHIGEISMDTKVSFSELRYESWKLITYLMAEAEAHDKAYVDAVDVAIAKGDRPPQRNYGQLFEGGEKVTGVGLSDPVQDIEVSEDAADIEKARTRICELRKVLNPRPEEIQGQV